MDGNEKSVPKIEDVYRLLKRGEPIPFLERVNMALCLIDALGRVAGQGMKLDYVVSDESGAGQATLQIAVAKRRRGEGLSVAVEAGQDDEQVVLSVKMTER